MIAYKDTSRAAWQEFIADRGSATLDSMILSYLAWCGDAGATCEEIEIGIDRKHQCVSGNLRHLVERGQVENTGTLRRNPRNRNCIVWRTAPPTTAAAPEATTDYRQMALL
jgi:hypothetical protein